MTNNDLADNVRNIDEKIFNNKNYDHHLFTSLFDEGTKNMEKARQLMKSMNWI